MRHALYLLSNAAALSLNAFTPNVYWPDQPLPIVVTGVQSDIASEKYGYYDLPFVCQPREGPSKAALTFGEIIRGDRTLDTDYDLKMLKTEPCKVLCSKSIDAAAIRRAYDLIQQGYRASLYTDELPGAAAITTHDKKEKYYISGSKLGEVAINGKSVFLYNHYNFVIKWRYSDNHDATRVVLAFEVYPRSIDSSPASINSLTETCSLRDLDDPNAPLALDLFDHGGLRTSLNVTYTYSVYFREDLSIHWIDRWNPYFSFRQAKVVWYTTLSSASMCLIMSAIIAIVLLRTVSKEISEAATSKKIEYESDAEDLAGWKLIRNEVFRSPVAGNWLATIIGSGVQFIVSGFVLAVLSVTGLAHNRGRLSSLAIYLFAFAGEFSGYFSGSLYGSFSGSKWVWNALYTAIALPASSFLLMSVADLFAWISGSNYAIAFGTISEVFLTWAVISLPLVLVGAYVAHRIETPGPLGRVAAIPREIPKQPLYTTFWPSILIAGALPYGAICTESYFILKSFELHQDGYLFFILGSLSLVFIISLIIAIEISVIMVYLTLQHENHVWWWRAFLYGASSSGYIFVHATLYFLFKLQYGFVSGIIYFSYTLFFCMLYGLLQGTFSFLVSLAFVKRIYGAMKVDD